MPELRILDDATGQATKTRQAATRLKMQGGLVRARRPQYPANPRTSGLQRYRGTDNLLEHEASVDLLSYVVLPGIVVGAAASLWLSRFVAPLLYELEPHDLTTLLSAVAALVVAAAIAGWLPAHHASTLDPAKVLRSH